MATSRGMGGSQRAGTGMSYGMGSTYGAGYGQTGYGGMTRE
jgi:hypothetical protein